MNLRREISNALVARGYRRKDRSHFLRLDEQFSFVIDTGPLGRRPDIAPFVGIRHDEVERVCSELLDLPSDDWTGTIGANVGYVLGADYKWWEPPTSADEVLQGIDMALDRLRPFLTLERLPGAWQIKGTTVPGWRYTLMTTLLLAKRHNVLVQELEAARAELCVHDDEICGQFQSFQERLRSRLPTG